MIYGRLDVGVQRWMVDHDWTEFTPIQEAAIPTMLDGNGALLIAPTATGKTEAAFLPILSEIQRLKLRPISLLYISPLRALVNDQTRRARSLLEECGLRVGWWHSDLPARDRKKLLAYVPDALFTTPESIEVILSSDAYGHGALLGDVRYVVIDEIHAFATDDRGAQLMSLLARIEAHKRTPLVRVALSATVNNPDAVASWMASDRKDSPQINVVKDLSVRTRRLAVGGLGLSDEDSAGTQTRKAVQVIRKHSEGLRTIVFVNSRKDAEAITLALREAGVLARVHHGSIHREERQRVEESFRQEDESIIVATSTLELGIDIGDMDLVMQIGVPYSALSLLQRIGRSGRRAGREAVGVVYAIQDQDLPTCLAGADLALRGDVEDVHPQTAALQVLFHQIIQLAREKDRTSLDEIRELVHSSGSFRELDSLEVNDLVDEMLSMRFLETERGWIRVGYETERRFGALNYRDFYAVFEADVEWTVRTHSEVIGTIDRRYPISRDRENLLVLGGRPWRVVQIDETRLVLVVTPAQHALVPKWHNVGLGPSYEVMRRTYEILCGRSSALETPALAPRLLSARETAARKHWRADQIPIEIDPSGVRLLTYYGSAINQYLALLLRASNGIDRTTATPQFVAVNGLPCERAKEEFGAIMGSAKLRQERLSLALTIVHDVRVGRFWEAFGNKTKGHVLRHFFGSVEQAMARAECEFRDQFVGP